MKSNIITLLILVLLVFFSLFYIWFTKQSTKEGFQSIDTSGGLPQDADNPNITSAQIFGGIPQSASISIFKKAEFNAATANPDAIPIATGDPKTGAGGGPQITLSTIPDVAPPPDDIEAILNADTEGFINPPSNVIGSGVGAAAGKLGLNTDPNSVSGQAQQQAQGQIQGKAQNALDKAKSKVMNKLKSTKIGTKLSNAKKVIVKGIEKGVKKIEGAIANKLGGKAAAGMFKKIAEKALAKIGIGLGKAAATAAPLHTNPVTLALGIFLDIVGAIGLSLGVVLPLALANGNATCKPGWSTLSDNWPSMLDNIPLVGDIMSPIAPYLCFLNACEPGEQEDAGLCYPQCDPGYDGVGPVCWTHPTSIGVGVMKGCAPGWHDDGALLCQQPSDRICGDDCSKPWDNCRRRAPGWLGGGCIGGCPESCSDIYADASKWIGKLSNDSRLSCPADHPDLIELVPGVLPLCYQQCPLVGGSPQTITTNYPVYIKKLPTPNGDAAQKAILDASKNPNTTADQIATLQKNIQTAASLDSVIPLPANAPYIRNPAGPRIGSEPAVAPIPSRRWPATETPQYTDLVAGIENGRVVFYSDSLGGWQTFESIFGTYGTKLTADKVTPIKVSMTSVGPQIITSPNGVLYRWNSTKSEWEPNGWGNFKDLGAVSNDFTWLMGTNDQCYYFRWPNNKRGAGSGGGGPEQGWYGMIGVGANDTGDVNRDHGNFFTTNSSMWHAMFLDWEHRYMFGNDKTIDPVGMQGHKATDLAVSQDVVSPGKNNFMYYISSDKGYIFAAGGPNESDLATTRKQIKGPLPGTAITSITASIGFPKSILYVISGGRFFKGVPPTAPTTNPNPKPMPWPPLPLIMCTPADGFRNYGKIEGFGGKGNLTCSVNGQTYQNGQMMPNPDFVAWQNATNAYNNWRPLTDYTWTEVTGKRLVDIAIGPPMINDQFDAFNRYSTYLNILQSQVYPKYPLPDPSVDPSTIPTISQTITTDPRQRLQHIPLMPYLCMGNRGISYGRGVGKPKLKLDTVHPAPPPPPPPPPYLSSAFADDMTKKCFADFSSTSLLQDMCDFYYQAAVTNQIINADGTISYGYISKIKSVIGSSEQSCDVLCEITNLIIDPVSGTTKSSTVDAAADRRFYFAIVKASCLFVVVGSTNVSKTAHDILDPTIGAGAKVVTFTPVITRCAGTSISQTQCQNQDNINAMIGMYKQKQTGNVRVKQIIGSQNTDVASCSMSWQEVTYDPTTNAESMPTTKVGTFSYSQDKSTDACKFTLQGYAPAPPTIAVTPLATPIVLPTPVPAETTLQACSTTCKDPIMVQKLVNAFNTKPGNTDKILDIGKIVTPSALRCDIEADVFVSATKQTVKQTVRFDLAKDPGGCVFNVTNVGAAGSGTFIQSNTNSLSVPVNTKDFVISAQQATTATAQAALANVSKKISQYQGAAMTAHDSALGTFGQVETLGSCPKKCTDADVLNAIIDFYNTANYPASRTNVTKKTMSRVIKAGTAGTNLCDVNFEEKQETYADLYTSAPTIAITQKTKRFTMKDNGGCNFVVDPVTTVEGFQGVPFNAAKKVEGFQKMGFQAPRLNQRSQGFQNPQGGLPFAGPRRAEGFQTKTATPSVVNSSSPALNPPFTGSTCDLDCSNPDLLRAVKSTYESTNIEGFSPRRPKSTWVGMVGKWMHGLMEPFQDDTSADDTSADLSGADQTDLSGADQTDQGAGDGTDTAPEDWATTEEPADADAVAAEPEKPTVMASTTLKKVNKTLRVGVNKCEFEIVYDSTSVDSNGNANSQTGATGYFTGTFSREPNGCVFKPSNVVKTTAPIIPSAPSTKTSNISFSF